MGGTQRVLSVFVLALVLLLAGCGDDGGGSDPVAEPDEEASDDGGSGEGDGNEDAPPAGAGDLSIPLAPSSDAVATDNSGPLTVVQYIVPLDQQAATIEFYDEWTAGQPGDYQRTEAESGGVTWQNAPEPGAEQHIIAVLSPLDGDDFVTVTLTVGSLE